MRKDNVTAAVGARGGGGWRVLGARTIDETAMKANKIAPTVGASTAGINRQPDRLIGFTRSCGPSAGSADAGEDARNARPVRSGTFVSVCTVTRARSCVRRPVRWLRFSERGLRPICSNSIGADGD